MSLRGYKAIFITSLSLLFIQLEPFACVLGRAPCSLAVADDTFHVDVYDEDFDVGW